MEWGKPMKNNKGFTLVEVIISIAVLSIISVIFLQLFVKAKEIDDSTYQLDRSVMITNSAIEQIKALADLTTIESAEYFNHYIVSRTTEGLSLVSYFDDTMSLLLQENEKYKLQIDVVLKDELADKSSGFYDIVGKMVNVETETTIYIVKAKAILEQ